MGLRINDVAPNLSLETDQGSFMLHDFIGDSWTILFSHPKDFTPVCTTSVAHSPPYNVVRLIVGNEALLREDLNLKVRGL